MTKFEKRMTAVIEKELEEMRQKIKEYEKGILRTKEKIAEPDPDYPGMHENVLRLQEKTLKSLRRQEKEILKYIQIFKH